MTTRLANITPCKQGLQCQVRNYLLQPGTPSVYYLDIFPGFSVGRALKHEDKKLLELAMRNADESATQSDGKGHSFDKEHHGKVDGKSNGYNQSKSGGAKTPLRRINNIVTDLPRILCRQSGVSRMVQTPTVNEPTPLCHEREGTTPNKTMMAPSRPENQCQ